MHQSKLVNTPFGLSHEALGFEEQMRDMKTISYDNGVGALCMG